MSDLSPLSPLTNYPAPVRDAALRRFQLLRPHLEDGVALTSLAKQYAVPCGPCSAGSIGITSMDW